MAYELLSGAHPFARHSSPQRLIAAHITEPPASFRARDGVPPALATIVMRCLAKDPDARPASARELLASIDMVSTPAGGHVQLPARPGLRTGLLVAAGLLVLAAGTWALRSRAGAPPPVPATEQSLAVLPLANLSGDPADDYFGIGLAEEITRALAKNGVRVIGRVSAGALQAKGLDERAIARELGVGSLLTGTVQRAEGQVRITVTLVSATAGPAPSAPFRWAGSPTW